MQKTNKKRNRPIRLVMLAAISFATLGYVAASVYGANVFTTSPTRGLGPYTPADSGLRYEDVSFLTAASDKLTLRGWWIPRQNANRVLILVHVKNGTRSFNLSIARPLWEQGYNLLMIDLRGHGLSDGEHFSYGQYEQDDVIGAVNFLKGKGFKPNAIGVLAWSMGAASSLLAMGRTPDIKAAVIDSSYGDLSRIAGQRLGLLGVFYPGILVSSQLLWQLDINAAKPEQAFKNLGTRRVLLIHGDQDATVPVSEVYNLKQAGGANVADMWVLPGVGHAAAYNTQPAEYLRRITTFFDNELSK